MLGSNNYLGLTNHPEVKEAAATGLAMYGTGCAGSRLLNGTLDIHAQLEERLAEFLRREAVLTFSTGYQVNLGVLSCLLGRHDIAFLDSLDHACIIDGCRLGFGRSYKYRHNDMVDLEKKLANAPADKGKIIVVDGVFSMEGDLAPLVEIAALKNRYGRPVDGGRRPRPRRLRRARPRHAGALRRGRRSRPVMGTFSKSLAAIGGFIAGSPEVIDYIKHEARSEIFSAAPPPASVAAALKAVEIIEREPERRKQLWENTTLHEAGIREPRLRHGRLAIHPVIPLVVGEDMATFLMTDSPPGRGGLCKPGGRPSGAARVFDDPDVLHGDPHPGAPRPVPGGLREGRARAEPHLLRTPASASLLAYISHLVAPATAHLCTLAPVRPLWLGSPFTLHWEIGREV